MKKIFLYFLLFTVNCIIVSFNNASSFIKETLTPASVEGRWDLTVEINGKKLPSWLEVTHSGLKTLIGQFVGTGGSARPIAKVYFNNDEFNFAIPPQWDDNDSDLTVHGSVNGDNLSGTMKLPNGKIYNYTGVRAPLLRKVSEPVWDKPLSLFNGKTLNGWHAMGDNQWVVDSGILRSPHSGSNLVTDTTFKDFKLHIEFRYPPGSNSGVYLRGRYEVQIEDTEGEEPVKNELGSIYGFLAPTELLAKGPGQWQSYDITLTGRMVTISVNGKTVICNQEIPGITGGAINSNEGEPGPLLIQGDHGPIDYRNIVITPSK